MKKGMRIFLALVVGFAAAMAVMSAAIYFGYSSAYELETAQYTVRLFGISIYELTRTGAEYAGQAIGPHMGLICGIFMAISLAVMFMVRALKARGKNK